MGSDTQQKKPSQAALGEHVNMNMGFRFSQQHGLTIEQRYAIAQSVGARIVGIRNELGIPTRGYEAMRNLTASSIADAALRSGVFELMNNRGVRQTIIEAPQLTTVHQAPRLEKLMVAATYAYHNGSFASLLAPDVLVDHGGKVPIGIFSSACLSPVEIQEQRSQILRVLRQGGSQGGAEFQIAHLKELDLCCRLAKLTQEDRKKGEVLLKLAMSKGAAEKLSPLVRYSRELVFQREYLPVVADRLLARVSSAAGRSMGSDDALELALRNTICEFTLLAMGIITPGLSHRGDGEMLQAVSQDPVSSEQELGFDLAQEFQRRINKPHSTSLNQSLLEIGTRGGELFGNFLDEPFSNEWPTVFKSLGGKDWLDEIRAAAVGEKAERSEAFDSIFVSAIERTEFHELTKQLIIRSWYPALDPYLSHRVLL